MHKIMPSIFTLKYEITHKNFPSGWKIKLKSEGTEVLQMEKFSETFCHGTVGRPPKYR